MFGQVFCFNCNLKSAKASDSVSEVYSMYTQIMPRIGLLPGFTERVCKAFGNTEVVVGLTGQQAITAL